MRFLLSVFLFFVIASFAIARRYPEFKKQTSNPQPKLNLNLDILPPLQDVLESLGIGSYLKNFVRMGITETRLLLRLSSMDFQLMSMEWDDFTEEKIKALKNKIKVLIEFATVKVEEKRLDLEERNKLVYGRVFLPNGVQSFEYNLASFGGKPFFGASQLVLSENEFECNNNFTTNYEGKIILARRGNCTFLDKALNAKSNNASGILVANSLDRIESPASGVGINRTITDELVNSLGDFYVVCMSNTSWLPLNKALSFNNHNPLTVHVVPLKCQTGGQCLPVTKEEKDLQSEVSWGRIRIRDASTKQSKSFEFLSSNFGSNIPIDMEIPIELASPIDACSPLNNSDGSLITLEGETSLQPSKVIVVHRGGGCRFDTKVLYAQQAGARAVIIVDVKDDSLQRMGGLHPEVGQVGIPSILVPANAGFFLSSLVLSNEAKTSQVFVEFFPSPDNSGLTNWLELAYNSWSEDHRERSMQLQGLIPKYQDLGHNDIVQWLQRRIDEIDNALLKSIETDA